MRHKFAVAFPPAVRRCLTYSEGCRVAKLATVESPGRADAALFMLGDASSTPGTDSAMAPQKDPARRFSYLLAAAMDAAIVDQKGTPVTHSETAVVTEQVDDPDRSQNQIDAGTAAVEETTEGGMQQPVAGPRHSSGSIFLSRLLTPLCASINQEEADDFLGTLSLPMDSLLSSGELGLMTSGSSRDGLPGLGSLPSPAGDSLFGEKWLMVRRNSQQDVETPLLESLNAGSNARSTKEDSVDLQALVQELKSSIEKNQPVVNVQDEEPPAQGCTDSHPQQELPSPSTDLNADLDKSELLGGTCGPDGIAAAVSRQDYDLCWKQVAEAIVGKDSLSRQLDALSSPWLSSIGTSSDRGLSSNGLSSDRLGTALTSEQLLSGFSTQVEILQLPGQTQSPSMASLLGLLSRTTSRSGSGELVPAGGGAKDLSKEEALKERAEPDGEGTAVPATVEEGKGASAKLCQVASVGNSQRIRTLNTSELPSLPEGWDQYLQRLSGSMPPSDKAPRSAGVTEACRGDSRGSDREALRETVVIFSPSTSSLAALNPGKKGPAMPEAPQGNPTGSQTPIGSARDGTGMAPGVSPLEKELPGNQPPGSVQGQETSWGAVPTSIEPFNCNPLMPLSVSGQAHEGPVIGSGGDMADHHKATMDNVVPSRHVAVGRPLEGAIGLAHGDAKREDRAGDQDRDLISQDKKEDGGVTVAIYPVGGPYPDSLRHIGQLSSQLSLESRGSLRGALRGSIEPQEVSWSPQSMPRVPRSKALGSGNTVIPALASIINRSLAQMQLLEGLIPEGTLVQSSPRSHFSPRRPPGTPYSACFTGSQMPIQGASNPSMDRGQVSVVPGPGAAMQTFLAPSPFPRGEGVAQVGRYPSGEADSMMPYVGPVGHVLEALPRTGWHVSPVISSNRVPEAYGSGGGYTRHQGMGCSVNQQALEVNRSPVELGSSGLRQDLNEEVHGRFGQSPSGIQDGAGLREVLCGPQSLGNSSCVAGHIPRTHDGQVLFSPVSSSDTSLTAWPINGAPFNSSGQGRLPSPILAAHVVDPVPSRPMNSPFASLPMDYLGARSTLSHGHMVTSGFHHGNDRTLRTLSGRLIERLKAPVVTGSTGISGTRLGGSPAEVGTASLSSPQMRRESASPLDIRGPGIPVEDVGPLHNLRGMGAPPKDVDLMQGLRGTAMAPKDLGLLQGGSRGVSSQELGPQSWTTKLVGASHATLTASWGTESLPPTPNSVLVQGSGDWSRAGYLSSPYTVDPQIENISKSRAGPAALAQAMRAFAEGLEMGFPQVVGAPGPAPAPAPAAVTTDLNLPCWPIGSLSKRTVSTELSGDLLPRSFGGVTCEMGRGHKRSWSDAALNDIEYVHRRLHEVNPRGASVGN